MYSPMRFNNPLWRITPHHITQSMQSFNQIEIVFFRFKKHPSAAEKDKRREHPRGVCQHRGG